MNYPIPISNSSDTGALTDFTQQPAAIRLGAGALVGALVGSLLGKHYLIGALVGAGAGYVSAAYVAPTK